MASAQCLKTYRLIRLAEVPDPDVAGIPEGNWGLYGRDNTFGINNAGQAVGTMRVVVNTSSSCGEPSAHDLGGGLYERLHGFLWLPTPAFGLAASPSNGCGDSVYDLHALAGFDASEFSFANAISMPGSDGQGNQICYVVGARLCDPAQQQSIAWRVHSYSSGPPASIPVTDLTPSGSVGANAYGVSPPMQLQPLTEPYEVAIIGKRGATCQENVEGFVRYLGPAGLSAPIILPPLPSPGRCAGVDIDGPLPSLPDTVLGVGYRTPIPSPFCTATSPENETCFVYGVWGEAWQSPAYGGASPQENYPDLASDGQMRGLNRIVWVAGWGKSSAGSNCARHAVVWGSTLAVYDITPDPTDIRKSRAEAISMPDLTGNCTVVGWSPSAERALVWRGTPGGAWCESDATFITANDVDCVVSDGSNCLPNDIGPNGHVVWVTQLHDVNDFSLPVGIARDTRFDASGDVVSDQFYACVLGPIADLDEDLDVDMADFSILLGEWGNAISPANLFCSGVVDGDDMGALVTSWSGSGVIRPVFPPSVSWGDCACGHDPDEASGESSLAGTSPGGAEAAIAALGFGTIAEFGAWLGTATPEQVDAVVQFIQWYLATQGQGPEQ